MSKFSQIQSNFSSGELSERLDGRVDLQEYFKGLLRMENFIPLKSGGATYRPSTEFVADMTPLTECTFIPFLFIDSLQIVSISVTAPHIKVTRASDNSNQAFVIDPAVTAYFTANPTIDPRGFVYSQVEDFMFVTHTSGLIKPFVIFPDITTGTLVFGAFNEILAVANKISPTNKALRMPMRDFNIDTTIKLASTGATLEADNPFFDPLHVGSYFRLREGSKELIGQVTAFTTDVLVDFDILVETTPPITGALFVTDWQESAWSDFRGWPRAISSYQQRLIWGGCFSEPATLWCSFTGNPFHMLQERFTGDTVTIPSLLGYDIISPSDNNLIKIATKFVGDADAFSLKIYNNITNGIRWINSRTTLEVGCDYSEHIIRPTDTGIFGPRNVEVVLQSSHGSSRTRIARIGDTAAYISKDGRNLRDFKFSLENGASASRDLSILAEDIVDFNNLEDTANNSFVDMAWHESMHTLWLVTSAFQLIGFTAVENSGVMAWHKHTIGGTDVKVKGICVGASKERDDLYLSIERTVDGNTVNYMERMGFFNIGEDIVPDSTDIENHFKFLDCNVSTYSPGTDNQITAAHLPNESVSMVQDGEYKDESLADGGGLVTLPVLAKANTVGYKYTGYMSSMKIEAGAQIGSSQSLMSRIDRISLKLFRSLSGKFGSSLENMYDLEIENAVGKTFTGNLVADFDQTPDEEIQYHIIQDKPQPLTVLGITMRGVTKD